MRRNLRVGLSCRWRSWSPAGVARAQTKGAAGAPGTAAPPPAAPAAAPAAAGPPRRPPLPRPRPRLLHAAPAPRRPLPLPQRPRPRPRRRADARARADAAGQAQSDGDAARGQARREHGAGRDAVTQPPDHRRRQPHLCQAGRGAHLHHRRQRRRVEVRLPRLLPRAAQGQLRPAVTHRAAQHVQHRETGPASRRARPCRRIRRAPSLPCPARSCTARRASPATSTRRGSSPTPCTGRGRSSTSATATRARWRPSSSTAIRSPTAATATCRRSRGSTRRS